MLVLFALVAAFLKFMMGISEFDVRMKPMLISLKSVISIGVLGHLKLIHELVGHLTGLGGVSWLNTLERTKLRKSVEQYRLLTNACLLSASKHCSTAL